MTQVRLLFSAGCPNWRQAEDVVRQALAQVGLPGHSLTLQAVETHAQAEQLQFRGSPTVLVDGRDPWCDPAAPAGLSCRVFPTPAGLVGAPSVQQVVAALLSR